MRRHKKEVVTMFGAPLRPGQSAGYWYASTPCGEVRFMGHRNGVRTSGNFDSWTASIGGKVIADSDTLKATARLAERHLGESSAEYAAGYGRR